MKQFYNSYNYPDGREERKKYWKKHLLKHIDFSSLEGKKVLDVGCGQGTISALLSDYGAEVYAIDLSSTSIAYVKKHYQKIKVKEGNALDITFPDNFFDVVLSIGVLHHTPDTYKGFTECVRVCKPNGQFIVMLYTKWNHYPILYRTGKFLFRNKKPHEVPKFFIKATKKFTEAYYGEKRTDDDAIQLIADQFFTPIAKFHSLGEIKQWGRRNNLNYVRTSTTYFGQHRIWSFKKQ